MPDPIRPEGVPDSLVKAANGPFFRDAERVISHDEFLRRQVAAILTALRDIAPGREALGRCVREVWVACAPHGPDCKPSHLTPWDELDEWNKEVDRCIGEAIRDLVTEGAAPAQSPVRAIAALLGERVRVTLDTHTIIEGKLLGFGDGGNFEIQEDDGMVHYAWPMLDIEEVTSDR